MTMLLLTACSRQESAGAPPPAPEVGVYTVRAEPLALTTDLPGRTAAYRMAEVRPQVNGIIQQRLFTEGAVVERGQPLYQIDAATYEAVYRRAEASLTTSERLAKRYAGLLENKAISRQQYDDAYAAWKLAEAELELARIDLVYTEVRSPIAGRIGRSAVTEGALVTSGQPQALATVQQLDPIYVDVTQPVVEVLRLRDELASGRLESMGDDQARVRLRLEDGSLYPLDGTLKFSEVSVDPGTASVTLRAEFPNPEGRLLPGMFVHARLNEGVRSNAVLVPQQGVQRDTAGNAYAWVITAESMTERRPLKTERTIGNHWLISDGLQPGERVVTEGVQRLRPGMEVKVQPAANLAPVLDFERRSGTADNRAGSHAAVRDIAVR